MKRNAEWQSTVLMWLYYRDAITGRIPPVLNRDEMFYWLQKTKWAHSLPEDQRERIVSRMATKLCRRLVDLGVASWGGSAGGVRCSRKGNRLARICACSHA